MEKPKIILIAGLGSAMTGLIAKLADHPELAHEFKVVQDDLTLYGQQQADLAADYELQLKEATTVIEDLKAELEAALVVKKDASKKPTVKVDAVTYEINHGSAPYTAKELAEKPDVCREILAIEGQNALTKL